MSKLDCHTWTPSQLMTWERSLREEVREWESKKNRIEAHYDKKLCLVESREDCARFWERKLDEKESILDERESAVRSKELELSAKEEDLYSEAYHFRREYRCDHKVRLFVCCLFYYILFPGLC